jgi:lycopene cyclase domain-containing protein
LAEQSLSYLFFELAAVFCAWLALYSLGALRTLATKRFLFLAAALYVFWVGWDLLAASLGVFLFPMKGSLPIRIMGLPLEEHLFFLVHTIAVWSLVVITEVDVTSTRSAGQR